MVGPFADWDETRDEVAKKLLDQLDKKSKKDKRDKGDKKDKK